MRINKRLLVIGLAAALVLAAIVVLIGSMLGGKGKKDESASQGIAQSAASQSAASSPAVNYGEEDIGEIRELVSLFNDSYFVGDPEGVLTCLSSDYAGEDNVYTGNGTITEITIEVQGSIPAEGAKEGDTCPVKVRYKDDEAGDAYQYLSLELVKQSDAWRIRTYGRDT